MTMRKIVLALALSAFSTTPVFAYYRSGNDIASLCIDDGSSSFNEGTCAGYIVGTVDALQGAQEVGYRKSFCIPSAVTIGQLVDVVKKFFADHPADRHFVAASLVEGAVTVAFPCK
jgi:hypothetical protein